MKQTTTVKDNLCTIKIRRGLFVEAAEHLRSYKKVAVVCDKKVYDLYGKKLIADIGNHAFAVIVAVGEKAKTLKSVENIYKELIKNQLKRTDIIVALGGGVAGDVTAFVAATYMRGTEFVNIPTTLTAQIDSSIGAKCGINLGVKNIIGTFYQPKFVLIDPNLLKTLDKKHYNDGISEAIKYGALYSKQLLDVLSSQDFDIEDVIKQCVKLKIAVTQKDLTDKADRRLLNFGHTIGHAIELAYNISHGQSVAYGMLAELKAGILFGSTNMDCYAKIYKTLKKYGLAKHKNFDFDKIVNLMLSDKKNTNQNIVCVQMKSIGEAVCAEYTPQQIKDAINSQVVCENPTGKINAPSSKSYSHRALICAAMSDGQSVIKNISLCDDVLATMQCLRQIGTPITIKGKTVTVDRCVPRQSVKLNCNQSGTTLRFMLPLCAAMGIETEFYGNGNLFSRPNDDLLQVLKDNGVAVKTQADRIQISGKLKANQYKIDGNISSQFVSGLLLALPLVKNASVSVPTKIQSADYVNMTISTMKAFGITVAVAAGEYTASGSYKATEYKTENDYSAAAFFFAAKALGCDVSINGLSANSLQGDKRIVEIVKRYKNSGDSWVEDVSAVPDLTPIIALLMSVSGKQCKIINADRLAYKETNRLHTISQCLNALGADITVHDGQLHINGKRRLSGGVTDSYSDHRIAMTAAIARAVSDSDIIIKDAGCVSKSYTDFFAAAQGEL